MELKTNKPDLLILRDRPWHLHMGFLAAAGLTLFLAYHSTVTAQPQGYFLTIFPASIAAYMVILKDRYTLTFSRSAGTVTVKSTRLLFRHNRVVHHLDEVTGATIGSSTPKHLPRQNRMGTRPVPHIRVMLVIPKGQSAGLHPGSGWARGARTRRMATYINDWLDSARPQT